MKTLQEQLDAAGLHVFGCCERLSAYGPDLLQTSQLLQDFTPAEADILGASMLLVRAEPGQVMIREGEAGDWMMLILKGTVDVTKRLELPADADAGAEAAVSRVAVVRAGAAVGDMSMLDSEPRYATCTAIEPVEAGVWGRHEIALLIRDHPGVGAKLLVKITQMMAQRLRNTSNQLVRILRKQATAAAETAAR
ncbi:Crp/Fnr family transcriptional regulator [Polaromonas sp. CT11-55]|uniref:Crp/Fnr family transcriptional regulator n=1 Tax=Polaromonas sp. CT11-55 TaxID=3243045 RepID=UPI0039A556E2